MYRNIYLRSRVTPRTHSLQLLKRGSTKYTSGTQKDTNTRKKKLGICYVTSPSRGTRETWDATVSVEKQRIFSFYAIILCCLIRENNMLSHLYYIVTSFLSSKQRLVLFILPYDRYVGEFLSTTGLYTSPSD